MQIDSVITKMHTFAIIPKTKKRWSHEISVYTYAFMVKEYNKSQINFLIFITEQ